MAYATSLHHSWQFSQSHSGCWQWQLRPKRLNITHSHRQRCGYLRRIPCGAIHYYQNSLCPPLPKFRSQFDWKHCQLSQLIKHVLLKKPIPFDFLVRAAMIVQTAFARRMSHRKRYRGHHRVAEQYRLCARQPCSWSG